MKRLPIPDEALRQFCERHGIRRLSLFGSSLKGTAHEGSDVDLLVEFLPEAVPDLLQLVEMEDQLGALLGRRADLRTPRDLSRHFREQVVRESEVQYERG